MSSLTSRHNEGDNVFDFQNVMSSAKTKYKLMYELVSAGAQTCFRCWDNVAECYIIYSYCCLDTKIKIHGCVKGDISQCEKRKPILLFTHQ